MPLMSGFEYGQYPVLKGAKDNQDFDLVKMEWGFLPDPDKWPFIKTREDAIRMREGYKDEKGKFHPQITTLNATAEEMLLPGKMYRDAALKRRCLVLSSGFYEWRHIYPVNKKSGLPLKTAVKYPYYISLPGKEYFYMAGIYNPWTDLKTGEHVETFAIVTTKANPLMKQVHNSKERMPTILDEDLAYEWLFGEPDEKRISEIARTQFDAGKMNAFTIAKDFRTALDPSAPFDYGDELPPLIRAA
jgi:putative SOS response-associated peptidase YedK